MCVCLSLPPTSTAEHVVCKFLRRATCWRCPPSKGQNTPRIFLRERQGCFRLPEGLLRQAQQTHERRYKTHRQTSWPSRGRRTSLKFSSFLDSQVTTVLSVHCRIWFAQCRRSVVLRPHFCKPRLRQEYRLQHPTKSSPLSLGAGHGYVLS